VIAAAAASGASATPQTGEATLRLELRVDTSHGFYAEGAYYYAALRRSGFSLLRHFSGSRMVLHVGAGQYVLRSFARPCDGNCSRLDPPTDGCATRISLRAGTSLRIRVVAPPGSRCRLRMIR
jgi:hypothetical protein